MNKPRLFVTGIAAFVAGALALGMLTPASAETVVTPTDLRAACIEALTYPDRTDAETAWLTQCKNALRSYVTPTPTTEAPTPTTIPPVTTIPPTTTVPPISTTTPPAPTPTVIPNSWPNASNTGPDPDLVLSTWIGSCIINTSGMVVDRKIMKCSQVVINASHVTIKNSIIEAGVSGISAVVINAGPTIIEDTEVRVGVNSSGLDGANFTATRVEVSGGNRGGYCSQCTIQDSWIHGGRATGSAHASGLRANQYSNFIHNTIICDIPGSFCSADLTGYPDFAPTMYWTITNNFFGPAVGSYYCAYGGNTAGKTHSNDANNATYIQFRDNVFARGTKGTCAAPVTGKGTPITDYNKSKVGWVWSGNKYEDGVAINV